MKTAILILLALAGRAAAQATEPPPPFPIKDLVLAENHELFETGRVAIVHGEVSAQGYGFKLGGLTMLQPVAIALSADKPDEPVSLGVGKEWASPDRTATTGAGGTAVERFRTDDAFELHVYAPPGTEGARGYELIVWVGDEKTDYADMPTPITFDQAAQVKAGATSAAVGIAATPGGGGTNPVLWVIAGLLGALVIIGGVMLARKKKA